MKLGTTALVSASKTWGDYFFRAAWLHSIWLTCRLLTDNEIRSAVPNMTFDDWYLNWVSNGYGEVMAINYYNQLEEPLWKTCQAEGKSSTSFIRKSLSTGSRYHLPASCFFDWRDFSIFIEDKDAHKAGHFSSSSECLETQNDSNLLSGLSIASKFQDRSSDIKWFSIARKAKYQWVSFWFQESLGISWHLFEAGQILKGYLDDPKRLEEMREKVFKIRKAFMWNDEDRQQDQQRGWCSEIIIEYVFNIF